MPDKEVANLQPRMFQRRVLPWTQILGYIPAKGHLRHRQAMAAWLARGGLVVDPENLVLTAGAQHAVSVAMSALLKPGDTLLMEELTYSGARALAHQQHLKIRGVAMDAEGLRPDALEAACRSTRARALYCMPRLQNPTSAVMPDRRRRQIAAIAEKHRLTVIEDDVYGFVSPEKTPLAALIPNRTVYLTSLSKSLFPGMRLGCVAAPPELIDGIAGAVWSSMIMASPIGADLLSGWIEDGTAGASRRLETPRVHRAPGHGPAHFRWRTSADTSVESAHLAAAARAVVVGIVCRARPFARRGAQRLDAIFRRGSAGAGGPRLSGAATDASRHGAGVHDHQGLAGQPARDGASRLRSFGSFGSFGSFESFESFE